MTTYRLTISQSKRGGWRERIFTISDYKEFEKKFIAILDRHGRETKDSYRAYLLINGGYGKNHETGATISVNWKGPLDRIWDIINKAKPGDDKNENG